MKTGKAYQGESPGPIRIERFKFGKNFNMDPGSESLSSPFEGTKSQVHSYQPPTIQWLVLELKVE